MLKSAILELRGEGEGEGEGEGGDPIFDWLFTGESHTVTGDGAITGLAVAANAYNTAKGTIIFGGTGCVITGTTTRSELSASADNAPAIGIDWATIDPDATTGDQYLILLDLVPPVWVGGATYSWGGLEIRASTRAGGDNSVQMATSVGQKALVHKDYVSDTRMSDLVSTYVDSLSWGVRYPMRQGYTQDHLRIFMSTYDVTGQSLIATRLRVWKVA